MLSIAILDDNLDVLNEYERKIPIWLKRNNIKGQIVIATNNYKEFLRVVRERVVNVCLLDINLNTEINGLYIASRIRSEGIETEIIFCSGMLEFISKAFDVNAYHFIIKPINNGALERCLIKLNNEIEKRLASKRTIEVKFGSRTYYVPIESIIYFSSDRDKLTVKTTARSIEINSSLGAFLNRIGDSRFIQCNKSTVINKDFLDYVDSKSKTVTLTTGFSSELGAKYGSNFNNTGKGEAYAI
jgi:DNA-binding LytR/AlgR family response regulator